MLLSSFEIKKNIIHEILDFSLKVESYKKSGNYSFVQISEFLSLAIEINNLINFLNKNIDPQIVKPKLSVEELTKIQRVLELVFKYRSDINSVAIDIGENLSSTNRYLQKGIDYIYENLSKKDYKVNLQQKTINKIDQAKPVINQVRSQAVRPSPKRGLGCMANLMFLALLAIGGITLYNMFFNNSATRVSSLIREYRSDQQLSSVDRPSSGTGIKVFGTDSLLKIVKDNQDLFKAKYPGLELDIESGDSSLAINDLIDGKINVAASSKIPSVQDRKKAMKLGSGIADHKIAIDSVVVFVSRANPIDSVTIDDLRKLYASENITWQDLGLSSGQAIKRFALSKQSGTYAYFMDRVMFSERISNQVVHIYDPIKMIDMVAADSNAIGFASISAVLENNKVKVVKVSSVFDSSGTKPITPSGFLDADLVRRGEYPLTRYLYLITPGSLTDEEAKIVDFARSPEIQSKLGSYGLVGIY